MIALLVVKCKTYFVKNHGFEFSITAIMRQIFAMPCHRYLIRLIHQASRRALPGERLWTGAQLRDDSVVRFLRGLNHEGYDVYFRPFAPDANAGYVLVDLDRAEPGVMQAMVAHGHEPCVVTETSPNHFQAWVRVSKHPLPFAAATSIARQLAQLYQADRASADGRHLGRLAGLTNQKPERRLPTGLAPWVKVQHAVAVMASHAPVPEQPPLLETRSDLPIPRVSPVTDDPFRVSAVPPEEILTVAEALAIYQTWLHRFRILQRFPDPDWSIVDFWIAKELLQYHVPPGRVKTVLRLASPDFPRSHADPEDYLRRTLARALQDLARPPFPAPDPCSCR